MRDVVGKKWHVLGIELLDYNDVGELNTIKAEYPSDLNKCCNKMFDLWLKKQPTASWEQLIEALRQPGIELGTLASNIEQMLIFITRLTFRLTNLFLFVPQFSGMLPNR